MTCKRESDEGAEMFTKGQIVKLMDVNDIPGVVETVNVFEDMTVYGVRTLTGMRYAREAVELELADTATAVEVARDLRILAPHHPELDSAVAALDSLVRFALNDDGVLVILNDAGHAGAVAEFNAECRTVRRAQHLRAVRGELVKRGLIELEDGEYFPTVEAIELAVEAETERLRALALARRALAYRMLDAS